MKTQLSEDNFECANSCCINKEKINSDSTFLKTNKCLVMVFETSYGQVIPMFTIGTSMKLTLKKGDLLFFGNKIKCDHVGIYKGDGFYYHSSGIDYGRNGIGIDTLKDTNDKISLHYQSKLISAGRIIRSYRWNKSIR